MSGSIRWTLLRAVAEHDGSVEFDTLAERHCETGRRLIEQYAVNATFDGFGYDHGDKCE